LDLKKRIIWISSGIMLLIMISLLAAGDYFYNVAINRSHEAVDLHGGGESVAAASLLSDDEQQAKLEEVMKWTDQQTFDIVEI
jgi:uncharacterized protein